MSKPFNNTYYDCSVVIVSSSPLNAEVRFRLNTMADNLRTLKVIVILLASVSFLSGALYAYHNPQCLEILTSNSKRRLLSAALQKACSFFSKTLAITSAIMLLDGLCSSYKLFSTDKLDHNDASAEETTREALEAAQAQVDWYSYNYAALKKQLKQDRIQIRDSQRVIQNKTTELERSEHRADAAERNLRAKNDSLHFLSINFRIKASKFDDQANVIALQALQIKEAHRDIEAMAQQMEDQGQLLWKASGNLTFAEQQITKLKAAVANESTTSDYCCALDAIHSRDETISELEKQLAQQAKDNEFKEEMAESLCALLGSLDDEKPAEGLRELEAWAEEREARLKDFVTESGAVAIIEDRQIQHLHSTNELQRGLLKNALETRKRQDKAIDDVKAQLTALEAREKNNNKVLGQIKDDKQHLINTLDTSENNLQAAKREIYRLVKELGKVQTEFYHYKLQRAIHDKKVESATNETQEASLATLNAQVATLQKQLETSEDSRAFQFATMNNKLIMIRQALRLTGIDYDLSTLKSPEHLASILENNPNKQELKLAETCGELIVADAALQFSLSARDAEITALKCELGNTRTSHHESVKKWQVALATSTAELAAAQRDSRELERKIQTLRTRLQAANDDNKAARRAKLDTDYEFDILTRHITDTAERLRVSKESLDQSSGEIDGLREKLVGQVRRLEELTVELRWEREEVRRLAGLLKGREGVIEGLERELVLGEEFVQVGEEEEEEEEDNSVIFILECQDEVDEMTVVQRDCSADQFEAVEVEEELDRFAAEFEAVEAEEDADCFADEFEAVDVEEDVDCFADEFETVEAEKDKGFADEFEAVSEDGEEAEALNGAPEVRVQ